MRIKRGLGVIVFLVGTAVSDAAEIRGRVLDAQGEAVVGVRVSVQSIGRKGRRQGRHEQATTGPDGTFTFEGLEPGLYTALFSEPSAVSHRRPVRIRSASQTVQLDFQLPPTPE